MLALITDFEFWIGNTHFSCHNGMNYVNGIKVSSEQYSQAREEALAKLPETDQPA